MAVVKNILVNIKARSDKLASGLRASSSLLGKFARKMSNAFDRIGKRVNKLRRRLKKFRKRLNKTFSPNMVRNVMRFGAVLGGVVVAAAVNAVRHFAKFEHQMSGVAAIVGKNNTRLGEMKELALELGKSTKFTATEAAQGMELLARAGFNAQEVMAATPAVLSLAAAGGLELAEAADITAQIIRGMGLEVTDATRVTDVLAQTAAKANTDVSMLGQAFSHVSPVAGALGMSLEHTAALLGTLSDAGLQADRAGTGLKAILSEMASEIEANGVSALDDLIDRGISVADAFAKFGKRGAPAILALKNMRDNTGKLVTELMNAEGAAEEMAETKMDNLVGSLQILKSAWENINITIGEQLAPTIRVIVEVMSEFFTAASDAFGAVVGGGEKAVLTSQQVVSSLFVVIDTFVGIYNGIKRTANFAMGVINGVKMIFAGALTLISVLLGTLFKLVVGFLDLIGVVSNKTADSLISGTNAFVDELDKQTIEAAKSAGKNFSDAFGKETDLDRWARKTKQNLNNAMKSTGDDAGNQLAESVEESLDKSVATMDFSQFEGLGEATEGLQKWIDKQTEAIEMFGMSTSEAELYKAAQAGVSEELLKQAEALDGQMKALENHERMMEQGKQLTKSMRTPLEVYGDRIAEIKELLKAGAISQEIFDRAMSEAQDKLEKAQPQTPTVEMGDTSSIQTAFGEFKFGLDTQDIQDKVATQSLKEEKHMVTLLTQIEEGINRPTGTSVGGVLT